ncbi:MAG: hypothetical protein ACE5KW_03210 [Dehalococcoidia bacterium]
MRIKPGSLFVYPRARVISVEPSTGGQQTVQIDISGMVCGL